VDPSLAISCRAVTKRFYYYQQRTTTLREVFIRSVTRRPLTKRTELFTLTGFDLAVRRGDAVGLIGANGSGKSTALRIIAGIYEPTDGVVETRGRVAAVIELGAGFHHELTGAENVAFHGAVMGMSRRDLQSRFDEIVDFAGIEAFIDVPVKYYSSGMQARLAFAVSVCLDPEVLLIDEVLAVGDHAFRQRCRSRLEQLRRSGCTLLIVSHNADDVASMCSRAVWLDKGKIRMEGAAPQVVTAYQANGS
jgi:ABC-type polysaccharide/polyol phosphate transport system ATPase subunit